MKLQFNWSRSIKTKQRIAREFAGEIEENFSQSRWKCWNSIYEEQTNNETENKSINGNDAKLKPKKLIEKIIKGVFKPKPYLEIINILLIYLMKLNQILKKELQF